MLDFSDIALLSSASFATSIISATVGMAGGTVLLSLMLFFFTAPIAIPLHGANQFVSNFRRSWLLKEHVRIPFFLSFSAGALIGNTLSAWLIKTTLSLNHAPLFIALVIIYTVFKPKRMPTFAPFEKGFFFVGFVIGFIGMFIGATGLILGTCFVRDDMKKEEVLATQGAIQTLSHLFKTFGFLWIGFDYLPWLIPLACMSVTTLIGTTYGVRIMKGMSQELFKKLFRGVLVISAIQLLYKWSQIF